jgi:two-component system nitrate/nitrite response regulator NarL
MTRVQIRVVTADDHPIFRSGLRNLLETEPGYVVVGEASEGHQAVTLVRSLRPDVFLLDFAMPGLTGIEVLRELGRDAPTTRTVLLTASLAVSDMTTALRLGAVGVLLKTSATELLFKCLRSVMAGQYWVGRDTVGSLIEALSHLDTSHAEPRRRPFGLTPRELEVVSLVATGASNREIAATLGLSEETVTHHLSRIFEKTGQSSRVELALFAAHHGLMAGG